MGFEQVAWLGDFAIRATIFMLMSMVFGMIFADDASKEGIMFCWTIAGVMLGGAILQMVFFTPTVIKRLGYAPRVIAFSVVLYGMLYACGATFGWFPVNDAGALVGFTITYLLILGVLSVIFTIVYRKDIAALNKGLRDFKEKM